MKKSFNIVLFVLMKLNDLNGRVIIPIQILLILYRTSTNANIIKSAAYALCRDEGGYLAFFCRKRRHTEPPPFGR